MYSEREIYAKLHPVYVELINRAEDLEVMALQLRKRAEYLESVLGVSLKAQTKGG